MEVMLGWARDARASKPLTDEHGHRSPSLSLGGEAGPQVRTMGQEKAEDRRRGGRAARHMQELDVSSKGTHSGAFSRTSSLLTHS